MAATIRLARAGSKKKPFYRIVAADSRARRDGRFLEKLGTYDVFSKAVDLQKERVQYWLDVGARTSDTVNRLLIAQGFDIKPVEYKPAPKKEEQAPVEEAPAAEAPAEAGGEASAEA